MKLRVFCSLLLLALLLSACSFTKFVPDGEYLLDKTPIKTDSKAIQQKEFKNYLRQTPNVKVFSLLRLQLGIYNLAGRDSSNWWNKFLKRIGEKPVVYNSALTALSVQQLQRLLENKGYINAKVESKVTTKGKKAEVEYDIHFNKPYTLRDYSTNLKNNALTEIAKDSTRSFIRPKMLFDVDIFNAERERISTRFRQQGYYNFNKEFLTYTADSALNSNKVDISLELRDYLKHANDSVNSVIFKRYTIRKVIYYTNTDANLTTELDNEETLDTVQFRDFMLISPKKRILQLDALVQNTYINPQTLYSDRAVERTYSALNSLGPVKYVNITFKEAKDSLLDCYIVIAPAKALTVSSELEGTYTNSYWGIAGNINTTHRNVFKGAETLTFQAKMALEWQDNVVAKEWGGQIGLKFPKFMLPFGGYDFKRNIHANTEFTSAVSYQYRPGEFKTTSVGAGMNYSWTQRQYQNSFQVLDLNYVYFPIIEQAFRDKFLATGLFNENNYKDHFIMRMGYAGSYNNASTTRPLQNYSTARYSVELAGNLLYALNHAFGSKTETDGSYKIFGIRYAQYVKSEYNITHHQIFNKNNRIVYHGGVGLGVPYGNANAIPYEKRFFSGGANSVRGWSESTLGPGVYKRIDNNKRDYNQVGDIKLDLNMEYRAKLVWVLEGALFVDAGNVWTIKDYDTQKGGTFKFDSFAKQIAISYGMGLRMDFKFFIARFDLGVRLFDPVLATEQWRTSPRSQDLAFHFGIGYPF